jgi:hypothetical protein
MLDLVRAEKSSALLLLHSGWLQLAKRRSSNLYILWHMGPIQGMALLS